MLEVELFKGLLGLLELGLEFRNLVDPCLGDFVDFFGMLLLELSFLKEELLHTSIFVDDLLAQEIHFG